MTITITYIIIGITVLVSFYAMNDQRVLQQLMMNPYQVNTRHQYYRLLTSGFIHADFGHLFFNMFSLYFFGSSIETIFSAILGETGGFYYVALYLLAIIVSDLPSYFKHRKQPRYNSLGASGGVAAVIFAFIIFAPLESICIYVALCMPGIVFGILYIAYSYYQGKRSGSNINHDAHLYGAVFGILFCAIVYPSSIALCYEQVAHWISNR